MSKLEVLLKMEFERWKLISLYVCSMAGILVSGWAMFNLAETTTVKSALLFIPMFVCFTMAFVIGTTLRRG